MPTDLPTLFTDLRQLYNDRPEVLDVLDDWETAAVTLSPSGTMRSWMTEHDGETVETLQLPLKPPLSAWAPGPRVISAAATYVEFDDSRRYYAGMRVLGTSPSVLAVADEDKAVIIYRDADTGGR